MSSKCTTCGNTENYNFALNVGLCDPCIGVRLEQYEAQLKEQEAWYDTLMEHCVKGYYKCVHCGGPVAESLCCAWCNSSCPSEPKKEGSNE